MGSGDWFKTILSLKKGKDNQSKSEKVCSADTAKSNGLRSKHHSSSKIRNGAVRDRYVGLSVEDIAAIRIQTAFRGYMSRKKLRHLKGVVRLRGLIKGHIVGKQALTTLGHLKLWIKIQEQIRARRIHMATEGRFKQKKQENQLKLEAKLHEIEVEWSGSSDTMEEILARIHHREEASVKRERAMAYAFTHQWRANSSQNQLFAYDLSKASEWGWSWKERWIAARPWEARVPSHSHGPSMPVSKQSRDASKKLNSSTTKVHVKHKIPSNKQELASLSEPESVKRPTSRKLVLEDVKTKEKSSSPPQSAKASQD